ncbi:MAG: 23S rRNA (adenine(2503)-C(2))-methyltransferase RlmN [Alcanivorax sp.]|nr:23S rRNA (adenine(2503)-C(2))-methyltransferase RlmN [Alcanivorax sp.]
MKNAKHKTDLKNLTEDHLVEFVESLGQPGFRGRQILAWIYRPGVDSFEQMTDLAKEFRKILVEHAYMSRFTDPITEISRDGAVKFGFRLDDGFIIESVLIPEEDRNTLCVSSQAGCAMGCRFCVTGSMGFTRNLSRAEIVNQVCAVRDWILDHDEENGKKLTNIVFMGMGEPLYNFENVRDAMKIAMDAEGIQLSRRRITLSTSGVVPEIARTAEEIGCLLAVSFHATTDETRNKLVPINKRWNIATLLDALREYPRLSNSERITFEYVMLKGVNDSDEDARRLVKLIAGIPAKINLIPFNEWPGSPYERSDWSRIERFADIVHKAGYASPIRTPRGEDIMAACGQLKSTTERARKSRKEIEAEVRSG